MQAKPIYRVVSDDDGQIHLFVRGIVDKHSRPMIRWCEERYGKPHPGGRWYCTTIGDHFWFRDEHDAFEFKMQWG